MPDSNFNRSICAFVAAAKSSLVTQDEVTYIDVKKFKQILKDNKKKLDPVAKNFKTYMKQFDALDAMNGPCGF